VWGSINPLAPPLKWVSGAVLMSSGVGLRLALPLLLLEGCSEEGGGFRGRS
jgi:hypothetical protein